MSKKKRNKKKRPGSDITTHIGNIMTKAKVHNNENLKQYDRKKRKKTQRKELEE